MVWCVCAGEVVVMAESRAEIDTAAPFASVKDALNIFGEGSSTRVQRNFTIGPSADQALILITHMLQFLSVMQAMARKFCGECEWRNRITTHHFWNQLLILHDDSFLANNRWCCTSL